jgi:hypothetical protein
LVWFDNIEWALKVIHVADHPSWGANDHGTRGNVFRDYTSCTDESIFSHDHVGKNDGAHPHAGARLDDGSLHALRAERVGIVCQRDSWSEKDVVLYSGVLGHIYITVDSDAIAKHAVVVDCRIVPDSAIIPDSIAFADDDTMAGFKSGADYDRGIDHAARSDLSVVTDTNRPTLHGASRRIAQKDAWINRAVLS